MLKKICLPLLLLLLGASAAVGQASWKTKISPDLLASWERGERADFLLLFGEKANWGFPRRGETRTQRAYRVFNALQQNAERSQARARDLLQRQGASANSLYVVNAIAVQAGDYALAQLLANLPEVSRLVADPWVQFDGPVQEPLGPGDWTTVQSRNGIEWGIEKINAPAVWSLGFKGQGITVGGADTGYEWEHPAIKPTYRGWNASDSTSDHRYNWHDAIHTVSPLNGDTLNPCGFSARSPCDDNNHGTHTMGTMTGDDKMGNQIGVAPGARWVACRNMERGWGKPSSYIECFQWFLAPTDLEGENPAPHLAPHVINNSWYCSFEEGCTDASVNALLREAVIALKASGVFVVVSNGNFGPNCSTTSGPPAYFEESFSVGSTRFNDTISGFSSRGPVLIDTSYRIKPNVSAPGSQIRSSIRNGGYANFSGTSMAGPHVAGLVALVLSARPDLAGQVELLEDLIEQTAIPFNDTLDCGGVPGDARPNQAYGWGRVDALGAVIAALNVPVDDPSSGGPQAVLLTNPVVEEAWFDLQGLAGPSTLAVFQTNGQSVAVKNWTATGTQERVTVSLRGLPAGVYFYQLSSGRGSTAGRIVKQ